MSLTTATAKVYTKQCKLKQKILHWKTFLFLFKYVKCELQTFSNEQKKSTLRNILIGLYSLFEKSEVHAITSVVQR